MITLEKARERVAMHLLRLETETIPFGEAMYRVLAEEVFADRDMPPFPRATMDGYACRREDLPGPLELLETIEAGALPTQDVGKGQCSKIMTGGMLPNGADCVIMQESIEAVDKNSIRFTAIETETNIAPRGQDLMKGDKLLQMGTLITPGHMGIMASAGKTRVVVSRKLKVGILATGSELIEAEEHPEGAQIRNSNSHQLAAQVQRAGHLATYMGIVEDHPDRIASRISEGLDQFDLLLLTGGASVGEMDLVPGILKDLGFHLDFDRVAMQPGKPVSFAHGKGKACFGLSGNPVSSFVQFEMLVRPYLEACSGMRPVNRRIQIRMAAGFRRKKADRLFFLPVFFTEHGSCEPLAFHGSGHLHALDRAIGFAELKAGQLTIEKGELVYVRLL